MTPQELYAAVKPLWERDAGFRVSGLEWEGEEAEQFVVSLGDIRGVFRTGIFPVARAAALIRDGIVERLGEFGLSVTVDQFVMPEGEYRGQKWWRTEVRSEAESLSVDSDRDRTLAMICAAESAMEQRP